MSLTNLAGAGINLSISAKNSQQKIIISFLPLILDNTSVCLIISKFKVLW